MAVAGLDQANVLWLPSIQMGFDYFRHDGRNQDATSGIIFDNDRSTFMIGASPNVVFAVTDADSRPGRASGAAGQSGFASCRQQ